MNSLLADFLFILLTLATIAGLVALAIGLDRLGGTDVRLAPGADAANAASSIATSPTLTAHSGGDS